MYISRPAVVYIVVWFGLMAYQLLVGNINQNYPRRKRVVILFSL